MCENRIRPYSSLFVPIAPGRTLAYLVPGPYGVGRDEDEVRGHRNTQFVPCGGTNPQPEEEK